MQSDTSKESVGSASHQPPTSRGAAAFGEDEGDADTDATGADLGFVLAVAVAVTVAAGAAREEDEAEEGVDVRVAAGVDEVDSLVALEAPSRIRLLAVGAASAVAISRHASSVCDTHEEE